MESGAEKLCETRQNRRSALQYVGGDVTGLGNTFCLVETHAAGRKSHKQGKSSRKRLSLVGLVEFAHCRCATLSRDWGTEAELSKNGLAEIYSCLL